MRRIFIALLILCSLSLRAAEGFWTYDALPLADIEKKYNFKPGDDWWKHLRLSSLRFNIGGSGAFVSKNGLVLTNHHVASDTLQKLSTKERDYLRTGFHARTQAEEIKAPDLELNMLVSIEDVTAKVEAAVKPEMSFAQAAEARRAAIAKIEKESQDTTKLRSEVTTFYQGGQFKLYRYKVYNDVRVVFAPETQIAFFGGDPDNFNFPRYCLDMALFRVYENGKPLQPENYLKWSQNGAAENELVFVSGHPGHTSRLNTVAHLQSLRDLEFPFRLKRMKRELKLLNQFREKGGESARRAQDEIFSLENSLKASIGEFQGLQKDPSKFPVGVEPKLNKGAFEFNLQWQIEGDPRLKEKYSGAWQAIEKARADYAEFYLDHQFFARGAGFNSSLHQIARSLVRLAAENEKPDTERLIEFTDARRAELENWLYSPAPIYNDVEQAKLQDSLEFMRDELGSKRPIVKLALHEESPAKRAAELISGTKVGSVEERKRIAKGGKKEIEESTDPMIVLVRETDGFARELRKMYEAKVEGVQTESYGKIARAIFDVAGSKSYPDGTFTLRLSYGEIKGHMEKGTLLKPFTTIGAIFDYAAQRGNKEPYEIPQSWVSRKDKLNPEIPFNFISTNDIIGGNSGSPAVNKNGEVIGLIFDGNIHSLVGDFYYDETMNRAVSVDSRAIIEAMRKIYDAGGLADELMGK